MTMPQRRRHFAALAKGPCWWLAIAVASNLATGQEPPGKEKRFSPQAMGKFGPTVTMVTEAPGLSAEEVESQVTYPIEVAINGLSRVRGVRSTSHAGRSVVWLDFEHGVDVLAQRQFLRERLQLAQERLPAKVQPTLAPQIAEGGDVHWVVIRAATGGETAERSAADAVALRSVAEVIVRPRLLAVPGVANVTVAGGRRKEIRVTVSPERLVALKLSLREVVVAIERAIVSAPGITRKGRADGPAIHIVKKPFSLDDLERVVLLVRDGVPVFIKDVATVAMSSILPAGEASAWVHAGEKVSGGSAVILSVQRHLDATEKDTSEGLRKVVAETQATLPPNIGLLHETFGKSDATVSVSGGFLESVERKRLAERVEKVLSQSPSVTAVYHTEGGPEGAEDQWDEQSRWMIRLARVGSDATEAKARDQSREKALQEIRRQLGLIPGIKFAIGQPRSAEHGAWSRSDFVVKIAGDDLATLHASADRLSKRLERIEGVADLNVHPAGAAPQLRIDIERDVVTRFGLRVEDVTELLEVAITGRIAGYILENGQRQDVVVKIDVPATGRVADLEKLRINTPAGEMVPLNRLARISKATSQRIIYRENWKRCQEVSFSIHGRSLDAVLNDAGGELSAEELPRGYHLIFADQRAR